MTAQPTNTQLRTEAENESPKPSPFTVKNKVAIVTGAGSGINLCFAALLLSHGCNVLFADLALRPEAQALITQYANPSGSGGAPPRALFLQTDVTNWAQLSNMFSVARDAFGTVDIVCPGAGIYDPHSTNFWHLPGVPGGESTDDPVGGRYATLDINLVHPIRTTQLAIEAFLKEGQGREREGGNQGGGELGHRKQKRVVLVSSIAGQVPNFSTPIYVAAKHGINGFTRSLAALAHPPSTLPRCHPSIRVNAVAPGVIKTPLWTEHPEKLAYVDESKDEWATPEEVAQAMLRCLEDDELDGGTILEVGKGQTRRVEAFNDPGPRGAGHTVSRLEEWRSEVFGWLGGEGWNVGERK